MITSNPKDIFKDLDRDRYYPIYLLMGDEPFFIDQVSKELQKKILTDEQRVFDETIVYGRDVDVNQLLSIVKRYPVISNYHLTIVREAQNIKDIEKLDSLLENDLKSTILVVCVNGARIDKRKRFLKLSSEKGVVFDSKKFYENQVLNWIVEFLKDKKMDIEPKASQLLLEFLGTDLYKINNELNKIISVVKNNSIITSQNVEDYVGISKDYNIFELNKAIGYRNKERAYKIIYKFGDDIKNHPTVVTISMVYSFFRKVLIYHTEKDRTPQNLSSKMGISSFFLKDYEIASMNYNIKKCVNAIEHICKADEKLKGFNTPSISDKEIMKDMLFNIFN